MKIIIPGGSGQIGTLLAQHFAENNNEVVVLTRSPALTNKNTIRYVQWDGKSRGLWWNEIDGADVVINLAGKNVNCRYNNKNQKLIMQSRVDSTRILGEAIQTANKPPHAWLQASTATIYAHTFDQPNDEDGVIGGNETNVPRKWDYSIEVAKTWETTADLYQTAETRMVKLRTSLVMDPYPDGIFATLAMLVRLRLGGKAGNGEQFVSWIHYLDFIRCIDEIIKNSKYTGVVNITAPNPLPFTEFMQSFRKAFNIRVGLPATKWMLEIGAFIMRTETELILKSRKVIPGKLLENQFSFTYPNWEDAVSELVSSYYNLR